MGPRADGNAERPWCSLAVVTYVSDADRSGLEHFTRDVDRARYGRIRALQIGRRGLGNSRRGFERVEPAPRTNVLIGRSDDLVVVGHAQVGDAGALDYRLLPRPRPISIDEVLRWRRAGADEVQTRWAVVRVIGATNRNKDADANRGAHAPKISSGALRVGRAFNTLITARELRAPRAAPSCRSSNFELMSTPETVLEQLLASINKSKSWEASLFHLALVQGFRYWRAYVDTMPQAAQLDSQARDRAAARQAVDIVIRFVHDENRAELEGVRDAQVERLLKWAGEKRAEPAILN